MYTWADANDKMPDIAQCGRATCPLGNLEMCDHFFRIAHKQRVAFKGMMYEFCAQLQGNTLFLSSPGEQNGAATQPQPMRIWRGLEILRGPRRYKTRSPIAGAVYIVQERD